MRQLPLLGDCVEYERAAQARGQRVTEVAWEDAGGSRGRDLEPRKKGERVKDEWTQTHARTEIEDTHLFRCTLHL